MNGPYFKPAEVAERLGVDVKTVLRWIANGELEALNVARNVNGGRPSWRITEQAIERFTNHRSSLRVEPGHEPRPRRPKCRVKYW